MSVPRDRRADLSEREQLADLHASPVPCPSVAIDHLPDIRGVETRCVLADGHAEHHTDGCLVWSDWTAERERDVDVTWVRAMKTPRPVAVSASYRGLRTV